MRTIIVYLSIVALLVCPFDCAAKLAAAESPGDDARTACCETCRVRELAEAPVSSGRRSNGDHDPAQPRPSEDGRFCLCEGAVFDATTRSPAVAMLEFSLLAWVDLAVTPSLATCAPSADQADLPPNPQGGRLTRITLRSLLL
jgi:hypothetical protein